MTLLDTVKTAAQGLRTNLSRSILTTLGIIIGITAVILVMAMSRGARDLILQQVQGIGAQTVFVRAGQEQAGPSGFGELFTDSLKDREVRAILDPGRVPGVTAASPNVVTAATVSAESEAQRTNVLGVAPAFLDIFQLDIGEGRPLTDEDTRSRARVAILGSDVREKLFGDRDAVGATVKIKGITFRVIGVFPPTGQAGAFDIDMSVLVPNSTGQNDLLSIKHYHSIIVEAESEAIVPRVAQDIRLTLRELHDITDPDKDDFFVATQADLLKIIGTVTTVLSALLISIAAISLVVGGVGIMNIMLVSVTERTREIGLRKALGATTVDILRQFLLESMLLTVVGGVIGTALGAILAFAASLILSRQLNVDWQFSFPWSAVALGIGVAAAVGLTFGIYPARKASRKSPIEALRYE